MAQSSYIKYLPEIFQEGEQKEFLEKFLDVFERILSKGGVEDQVPDEDGVQFPLPNEGVEEIVDRIHEFFNPYIAPGEMYSNQQRDFVSWLADWVDFVHKNYFEEKELRKIIPRVNSIYPKRGTPEGFIEYLELFTGIDTVELYETIVEKETFCKELNSPVYERFIKKSNYVFGIKVNSVVDLLFSHGLQAGSDVSDEDRLHEIIDVLREVVRGEKPAHTEAVLLINENMHGINAVTSTVCKDVLITKKHLN